MNEEKLVQMAAMSSRGKHVPGEMCPRDKVVTIDFRCQFLWHARQVTDSVITLSTIESKQPASKAISIIGKSNRAEKVVR